MFIIGSSGPYSRFRELAGWYGVRWIDYDCVIGISEVGGQRKLLPGIGDL